MTVSDSFYRHRKSLTKTSALYRYIEVLPKTLPIPTGSRCWRKEDVFSKESIRGFALASISNQEFLGSKLTNPSRYQKHNLNEIPV